MEKKIKNEKQLVLVKRVIPIDEEGKEIKYRVTNSGRQYTVPVWGVRGHFHRLKSGKVTYVGPYKKGKERNNSEIITKKEYRFVEEKIESDTHEK